MGQKKVCLGWSIVGTLADGVAVQGYEWLLRFSEAVRLNSRLLLMDHLLLIEITEEEVSMWIDLTEIWGRELALASGGRWRLIFAQIESQDSLETLFKRLKEKADGFPEDLAKTLLMARGRPQEAPLARCCPGKFYARHRIELSQEITSSYDWHRQRVLAQHQLSVMSIQTFEGLVFNSCNTETIAELCTIADFLDNQIKVQWDLTPLDEEYGVYFQGQHFSWSRIKNKILPDLDILFDMASRDEALVRRLAECVRQPKLTPFLLTLVQTHWSDEYCQQWIESVFEKERQEELQFVMTIYQEMREIHGIDLG